MLLSLQQQQPPLSSDTSTRHIQQCISISSITDLAAATDERVLPSLLVSAALHCCMHAQVSLFTAMSSYMLGVDYYAEAFPVSH
jgi:hypothetical protein